VRGGHRTPCASSYGALRDAGHSASTVKKMLTEAQRLGKVGRNVATKARPPSAKAAKAKRFPTWTIDETLRFLEVVAEDPHVACWAVTAYTGMRLGEVVALRWANVDLDAGLRTIAESIGTGPDGTYTKAPKSSAGHREIELDADIVAVLRAHRKAQTERRHLIGAGWRDNDLVFCEVDGAPLTKSRQSKRWSDLVRKHTPGLGIASIRFHDLRHSHATQLLAAEVRVDVVTERLGHESVAFTLDRYGHRYAGDQRSGLERLRASAR
jgi:integrase